MRIAMVAHSNAPWTAPYANHFISEGHDLKLISFHPDRLPGVDCEFVGHDPYRADRDKHLFFTRVPQLRSILRGFQPDVVLACYIISNGLTAALAWDGPLVVSARGAGVLRQTRTGEPGPPTALKARLLRYICRRATRIHAVSDEIAERLAAIGIPPERIDRFPLGIDLERFAPVNLRLRGDDPIHIICTRRHEPIYRNEVIVEALALLRDQGHAFRGTFVGGGPLIDRCRDRIRALNLQDNVRCVGPVSPERMPDWLQSADVYVSASASDGTSSSLLEAMACGLFPIISGIRANRDWIDDGRTGLFFDVDRPEQLARGLTWVLSNPDMPARAARINRCLVEARADRKICNEKLTRLLYDAAEHPRPSASAVRSIRIAGLAGAAAAAAAASLPVVLAP